MSICFPSIVSDGSFTVTFASDESPLLDEPEESPSDEDESADDESAELLDDVCELESELLLELLQPLNIHTLNVSAIITAEIFFIILFFLSILIWSNNNK